MATGNFLVHALAAIQCIAGLIDVRCLDRFTDSQRSGIRFFQPHDHAKQRRFSGTVWSDHSHDPARRQIKTHVFKEYTITKTLLEFVGLHNQLAELT